MIIRHLWWMGRIHYWEWTYYGFIRNDLWHESRSSRIQKCYYDTHTYPVLHVHSPCRGCLPVEHLLLRTPQALLSFNSGWIEITSVFQGFNRHLCLSLRVVMAPIMPNPQGFCLHSHMAYPVHYLLLLSLGSKCSRHGLLSLDQWWHVICVWLRICKQPVMAHVVRVEPYELTLLNSNPGLL